MYDDIKSAGKPIASELIDPFGRRITYLRLSVTDRCDLRCTYCMPERMKFLPRDDVLSLEELERIARAFMRQGVRKIRLTGGEPLVRRDLMTFIGNLGSALREGELDEITLTTNGILLSNYAKALADAGVKRVNVSLDTLNPDVFERITRRRKLGDVLNGIAAAKAAGLSIKLNTVAMKHENAHDISDIVEWAHEREIDISLIEIMPLGSIDFDRADQYIPLTEVYQGLEDRFTLTPDTYKSGGPSRYFRVKETGRLVGLISPLTNNFCDGCNRVRLTCTGRLYMCLGQDNAFDFRDIMRLGADDVELDNAVIKAIAFKPFGHNFAIDKRGAAPALNRTMSVTGG